MDPRSVSVAGRHYEHILELPTWFRTITIYDEEVSLFKCQLKNCVCFIQLKCYGFGHCSLVNNIQSLNSHTNSYICAVYSVSIGVHAACVLPSSLEYLWSDGSFAQKTQPRHRFTNNYFLSFFFYPHWLLVRHAVLSLSVCYRSIRDHTEESV